MVGGVGFLHHLTSAAQAVKHILATYSDDPGIDEDDVYFLNDSYTAALHPPDVYLISPIHFEGRLTGFAANFVHVTDIGAIDPGRLLPERDATTTRRASSRRGSSSSRAAACAATSSTPSSTWCATRA